jgi:hypothetical protein
MAYELRLNDGHGDWKSACGSVTVHNETSQVVAWYTWRRSYRRTEVEAGFVDETTRRKDLRYLPPYGFPGDLWEWFAAQCQARYGAVVSGPTRTGAQCA